MQDLPPISAKRWREKFTSQPGDLVLLPTDPAIPAILAELQSGRITPGAAATRFVRAGLTTREATLLAAYNRPDRPGETAD